MAGGFVTRGASSSQADRDKIFHTRSGNTGDWPLDERPVRCHGRSVTYEGTFRRAEEPVAGCFGYRGLVIELH